LFFIPLIAPETALLQGGWVVERREAINRGLAEKS